jgi:hypothetical protein
MKPYCEYGSRGIKRPSSPPPAGPFLRTGFVDPWQRRANRSSEAISEQSEDWNSRNILMSLYTVLHIAKHTVRWELSWSVFCPIVSYSKPLLGKITECGFGSMKPRISWPAECSVLKETVHGSSNSAILLVWLCPQDGCTLLHCNWLTNFIEQVLLEMLTVTQLIKKFPAFHGTQRFITVFTRACHWSLS